MNSSFCGLQTLLIQPAGSGQEAFVGVGDFDAASATPSERLDILNGRLRIRELPLAANENANLLKYLVTDENGVDHPISYSCELQTKFSSARSDRISCVYL